MDIKDIKAVYFVGAGGIGMSALARYYMAKGAVVAGYDRTPTALTAQLEREGMLLHFTPDIAEIPQACHDPHSCLVVYTPAIPADNAELLFFRQGGFEVVKRAEVLGRLTRSHKGLCVAGTHGKTTTSAICAHIMHQAHPGCNAFLGGICKNYGTNYILGESDYVVVEADEFDRSFHHLSPWITVITATDADHLDIYGTREAYLESFAHYTSLIQPGGALIVRKGIELEERLQPGVRRFTYGVGEGDFRAENVRIGNGEVTFDFVSPIEGVHDVKLGHPVPINVENAVAAMAMAQLCGCTPSELRYGVATYAGVERRFDFKLKDGSTVFLTDYAHHPREIQACAESLRQLYPGRRLTALFQPHLYSRTRDFADDFARSLGLFDEVLLCDIYPAREQPIPGITARTIYDRLPSGVAKELVGAAAGVPDIIGGRHFGVLVALGAGDIETYAPQITKALSAR